MITDKIAYDFVQELRLGGYLPEDIARELTMDQAHLGMILDTVIKRNSAMLHSGEEHGSSTAVQP